MTTKTRMDAAHPCCACGSPWRVTSETKPMGASLGYFWKDVVGVCSGVCWKWDMTRYRQGLFERRKRGW